MFNIFKKKDETIEQLLASIETSRVETPDDLKHLSDPLFKFIRETVKNRWTEENRISYKNQIESGATHEAFIFNYIVHDVADKLASGNFHVYRGTLSMEGQQYKNIFEHSINTMINKQTYTKEWADENLRKTVYKDISEAG